MLGCALRGRPLQWSVAAFVCLAIAQGARGATVFIDRAGGAVHADRDASVYSSRVLPAGLYVLGEQSGGTMYGIAVMLTSQRFITSAGIGDGTEIGSGRPGGVNTFASGSGRSTVDWHGVRLDKPRFGCGASTRPEWSQRRTRT